MYEIIITILIILLLVSVIRNRGSKQKFKQDREKQDFLDTIFYATEYSPASIIIANENCKILYVNRQFVTMSGYMPDEVIGKKTNIINSGMTNPSVYEDLWSRLDCSEIWSGEFINHRKDGQLYWEKANISKVYNKVTDSTNYVGVKLDITERKAKEHHDNSYNRALELLSSGAPLKDILDAIVFSVEEKNPGRIVCSQLARFL